MSAKKASSSYPSRPDKRAAVYVRMSTEHQKYSITSQLIAISQYAAIREIEITKVYEDEAKSGLTFERRPALRQLFADIAGGEADFSQILVYDVSRWGRFQDVDESAYYEHLCRRQGVDVIYCAEPFENERTPLGAVWKSVKRAMAAEFSREYSEKVSATLCQMARRGYFTGGHCIYGLERVAVDEAGALRGRLPPHHRKSLRSDHVTLRPGSPQQAKTVRKVFRLYANKGWSPRRIADHLNKARIPTLRCGQWHPGTVRNMLLNEKYIGVATYNRTSRRLATRPHENDPTLWIRTPGAYEPLISRALFERAQAMQKKRAKQRSDEQMLRELRQYGDAATLAVRRRARAAMASRNAYVNRFGSWENAYELAGCPQPWVLQRYNKGQGRLMQRRQLLDELSRRVLRAGGHMAVHKTAHYFTIDEQWHGFFLLLWSYEGWSGQPHWRAQFLPHSDIHFYLIGRVVTGGAGPIDYYLVPVDEIGRGSWRMSLQNGELDALRHRSLASVAKHLMSGKLASRRRNRKPLISTESPKGGRPRLRP